MTTTAADEYYRSPLIYHSPQKRTISRAPSAPSTMYPPARRVAPAVREAVPLSTASDPIINILETYLHVQEERHRLPGYFTRRAAHGKSWPGLARPIPPRPNSIQVPAELPPLAKLKADADGYDPMISCAHDLNLIYNEESMGLADIPQSPRSAGWRMRGRSKSVVVKSGSKGSPVGGKRIPAHNHAPIRADLANASLFLSGSARMQSGGTAERWETTGWGQTLGEII